ncbi:diphthine synthase [Nanoarchaeota archaeon]|nr:MAG: diphthine synthase [Nanoarchaeota archaeon]
MTVMLYLIGLGVDFDLGVKALNIVKKADRVYLESYTSPVDFSVIDSYGFNYDVLSREQIEEEFNVLDAKEKDIVILVPGDPLTATTHISLILEAYEKKVPYKVIHASSVYTAVCETGLQIYKFGRSTTMPATGEKSFYTVIEENMSLGLHTLVLVDPELDSKQAIEMLLSMGFPSDYKIVLASKLGYDSTIYYGKASDLAADVDKPFCIIIPGKLHFMEQEFLDKVYKYNSVK